MKKILKLIVNKTWFDMSKSGVKTEDYREITPYWFGRLFENAHKSKSLRQEACDNFRNPKSATNCNFKKGYYLKFKKFSQNTMTWGYPKSDDKDRILKLEHKGIEIRTGNPDWGAEPDKLYFVILHGSVVE